MVDSALIEELNLTSREIQRRLGIVGFGSPDAERLRALSDAIVPHAEELTDSFFGYLASVDDTSRLWHDRSLLDEARHLKSEHLKAMPVGEYGGSYVEQRLRLGALYARAGLHPRVFLGAFHHLIRTIGYRVMESHESDRMEGLDKLMSFEKLAFFDVGLIIDTIVFERERMIRQQQEAIRELSTPVMKLRERLLLLPIIGVIDTQRARQLTEDLLRAIRAHRARVVVMDITGVPIVDSRVANHLVQSVLTAQLMGAATVVTGLSPAVAQALVALGVDVDKLNTVGDLQGGVEVAERILLGRAPT